MGAPTVDGDPVRTTRWSRGRIVTTAIVVALVVMWGYVLYLAIGPGRQPPPNRLEDTTFATAAQARCSAALDVVDRLPDANQSEDGPARARTVGEANEAFDAMLDDLEALVPAGEDGDVVSAWLADWRTYLGDREDFVERLATDSEARLLVSAKENDQITEFIDAFAADNRMPACGTPIDV
jgi:hypothetical protein